MKRWLIAIVLISMFSPIFSFGASTDMSNMDGEDWLQWEEGRKYSFISGFMVGSVYVVQANLEPNNGNYDSSNVSKIYFSYLLPDKKKPKNSFQRSDVDMILYNVKNNFNSILNQFTVYEVSVGQIVEGLDKIYSDFKNKQVHIVDAVHVVKKQVKGSSPEEIEAILLYLRSGKVWEKLFFIDKDGKNKYASFP